MVPKGATLRQIYAQYRREFTAADLQKYTVDEPSVPMEQVIAEMEERERGRTGISSLKVRYNRVFGYYIEISKSNLHAVPADYLRKQTIAGGERYITPALKEYEEKVLGADERIDVIGSQAGLCHGVSSRFGCELRRVPPKTRVHRVGREVEPVRKGIESKMAMDDAVISEQDLFQKSAGARVKRREFPGILEGLPAVSLRITLRWRSHPQSRNKHKAL